ncbi:SPOR domain-containing protein [Salinivibrio sp. ES.052]|uniref:SPOR domain-containing protein n=1 Tax=Salinivibrio sp. ES.052 TaxID=1882823 RepID=UPI00092853C5|nr:SPOR domain-containing protein [Salinivibrio sp. ES.052]SIO18671.1 cell division protein FtsN [Salinivibrio sp. ES.052]
MATRDYVKRGKAPRKKNTRRQPTKGRTGLPLKWALLAVVLVGAFGYGLYLLSKTEAPTPEPTPTTKAKPARQNQGESLPKKPEEKWSYIEELESKKVEVKAKALPQSTRPYLMQCGAYRSQGQANERKATIAFQGLESQIKVSQGEKGTWHRVVLGPYPRKRQAERDRNMLRRAGIEPCAIWYWE